MAKAKYYGDDSPPEDDPAPVATEAPAEPTAEEIQATHDELRKLQDERIAADAKAEEEAKAEAKAKS